MKDIFSYNVDINKTAYMNWRTKKHNPIHNMIIMADGFIESSLILAEDAINKNINKKADIIIFPILFNVNHGIELYLKAIAWTLNILMENEYKIEGSHNIKQILSIVKSKVLKFEKEQEKREQFLKMILNLEAYVRELSERIELAETKKKDNMDFSRYPFTNNYIPHFYIRTFDNIAIDLENFILRFREIGKNLNLIASHYFYDYLEV
ncbi:hypothetical protein G3A_00775 [Bacillus sp. 17376]|uniref:HEPN domain-containing protein n=1 Tax=Mesobacillus boroniphilus JCM 21738 TaxID=1294265 RepID=W4RQ37_9BACI|nr:hypothetical protein [Mesobacillus boroniphilus]ESU34519.1 hypothetical protein G3A_00775 [Bacillus sp. 17376]GAE45983.1 hypothetical protein JCM21738_2838 [Mesobacillus boroniphilus JCM 21738]